MRTSLFFSFSLASLLSLSVAAIGCAAPTEAAPAEEGSTTEDLSAAARAKLTPAVKALYEDVVSKNEDRIFADEKPGDSSKLRGAARSAFREYDRTTRDGMINSGPPSVRVGTVNGYRVTFVSGDVSDTGTEYGFYDASGKLLAMAYSGQGMHANAKGVDWME